MPDGRGASAVVAVDGDVYVIGGRHALTGAKVDSIYRYEPLSGEFIRQAVALPFPLSDAVAAQVAGKVYVLGGFAKIIAFDPVAQTVRYMEAALPNGLRDIGVAVYHEKVYVFGGRDAGDGDRIYEFDPAIDRVAAGTLVHDAPHLDATFGFGTDATGAIEGVPQMPRLVWPLVETYRFKHTT